MKNDLLKEITPLTQGDCFTMFSRVKDCFDFPLHYHEEFELNYIRNARGAKRVIGDHIEEIDNLELVLVGPNLQHAWLTHKCQSKEIFEVTIQFHRDLFDEKLLKRNQLSYIRTMFEKSNRGISFSRETIEKVAPRLISLSHKHGFDSVLELLSILHDLSASRDIKILSDASFNNCDNATYYSRRIEKTMEYIKVNFDKQISLTEVAKLSNMTEAAFSRFFKSRTGMTFIDSLNEIRLGHASRLLIDTTRSVAEIAYHSGFNNISNFNRIFKKKKGITPKDFRESYQNFGTRIFV
ncbi:MAG: AraC family transcriptional regulator [Chitinophagaceae bacterium]|nr:MAG: AraC family transcriptional regulator [Chitinophagaceae bacterium]